jgi:hypothetical protein
MGTLDYSVVIQMVNLTVYRLRAVDDTSTWLIEDCNTFETTQDFDRVLKVIKNHMRVFTC